VLDQNIKIPSGTRRWVSRRWSLQRVRNTLFSDLTSASDNVPYLLKNVPRRIRGLEYELRCLEDGKSSGHEHPAGNHQSGVEQNREPQTRSYDHTVLTIVSKDEPAECGFYPDRTGDRHGDRMVVLYAAINFFNRVGPQYKVQTKITETNVEGILGAGAFRQDLESLGFGLPWNGLVAYTERAWCECGESWRSTIPPIPRAVLSIDDETFT